MWSLARNVVAQHEFSCAGNCEVVLPSRSYLCSCFADLATAMALNPSRSEASQPEISCQSGDADSGFERTQLAMDVSILICGNRCQKLADLMDARPGALVRGQMTVHVETDLDLSFSEEDVPVIITRCLWRDAFDVRTVYRPRMDLRTRIPAEDSSGCRADELEPSKKRRVT